jgi:secreted trypsin-like serine protease
MKKLLVGLAAAATLVASAALPAQGITYGHLDGNRHPSVGSLVVPDGHGGWFQACTVSVIAPDVVLTAAHCVQGEDPNLFSVTFDPVISSDSTVIHGTAHYDPRAYSTGESNPYDIAVVVLDRRVNLEPVQLPTLGLLSELKAKHQLRDATFTAVGYGTRRNTQQGGYQSLLNNVKRRYVEQSFEALNDQWIQLSMNPATGDGGTCYGDSGGPHFLGGVNSNLEVALTVTGDAVCKATDRDFRLDTAAARSFLKDYVTLP